ncbi:MAG TPA: NAD(P)H-dependent oxidoreductase subunit E [Chloroflexota bacterium]|jgi:NADH-quinone oxidoreductase subunit E|nr:NAD(P)H-dependent oxidoreductase subunit E [Chloroflexota bacterium]
MSLLSAQSVARIDELRRTEPTAQCALLTALRLMQRERRQIGVAEVEEIAGLLGLSAASVDGVARFYDQFSREPTGRRIVSVCRGIACYLRGAEERAGQIGRALGVRPGETTADGRLTLHLVECIGDCDHAPAVMLDDAFLGVVTPEGLRALLEQAPTDGGG